MERKKKKKKIFPEFDNFAKNELKYLRENQVKIGIEFDSGPQLFVKFEFPRDNLDINLDQPQ